MIQLPLPEEAVNHRKQLERIDKPKAQTAARVSTARRAPVRTSALQSSTRARLQTAN
jgi:hypothetical protein